MPAGTKVAKAESALKAGAKKRGLSGKRADAYVYGTLNNIGMMHGNKPTKRGLAKAKTAISWMALVDLKRSKKEKSEESAEVTAQPDYGYGLCIHLEDHEIEKLGIKEMPAVGDEFHLEAVAMVKGVSERDYGDRKEAGIDLQITMMEAENEGQEGKEESAAEEEAEEAEGAEVEGKPKTALRTTYRGRRWMAQPKLGSGKRFAAVEASARASGAKNPAAVAAAAGRKKYGAKRMAQMAAAGRRRSRTVLDT